MGLDQSKPYLSESELSSTESDSEYFSKNNMENVRTDAALRITSIPKPDLISISDVPNIERQLAIYEVVSLVYLLYDQSALALQELQVMLVPGNNPGLICRWARSEADKKWQSKLVEALCIIQNYQILKKLGYDKVDLRGTFMPHRPETRCFVKHSRKILYLIAEKLGMEQTNRLISHITKKFRDYDLQIPHFSENYLELYFLYWEQMRLDMKTIKSILKSTDLEECSELLNPILSDDSENESFEPTSRTYDPRRTSTTKDNTYLQPPSIESNNMPHTSGFSNLKESLKENTDKYDIDPDNPGIVLIINQEHFYTEVDFQFRNLLHEGNDLLQLESREGTNKDRDKLKDVFSKFGFKVIIRENLPHYDITKTINEITASVKDESSLIVCILSHGDKGVIYGANSCKIDVEKIQNIMCKTNKFLIGKPKVLILQSCQGKQCQKIDEEITDEDDCYTRDGANVVPSTADLLTISATIPGYAAVRNVNRGSWLIQELCNEILQESSRSHLLDICTKVVNKVSSKQWKEKNGINVMTPLIQFTLRKKFFLPVPKN